MQTRRSDERAATRTFETARVATLETGARPRYAAARDIMTMLLVGFGFLMSFLKLYGLGAVGSRAARDADPPPKAGPRRTRILRRGLFAATQIVHGATSQPWFGQQDAGL